MANPNDRSAAAQRSEQLLVESSERLTGIVQSATDAIIVVDEQQRILLFNAAAARMFGCPQQEAIGTHLERFVPPRFRAGHAAGFERVRQNDLGARHLGLLPTLCGLRATGQEFPCEASIAQHEVGGQREFTVIIRDITERQRSEEALRRRVEFESFLFDFSRTFIGLPDDMVDANMEQGLGRLGHFLQMDRITLLELSYDREELTVAYSWSAAGVASLPPVLTKHMQPWVGGAGVARRCVSRFARRRSPRGSGRRTTVSPPAWRRIRRIDSLRVAGEIAGAISFITIHRHVSWTPELLSQLRAIGDVLWNALKRRQAMQALLAARNTARESEERFRLIANKAPIMIWLSDIDKQVTYVNQRWLEFTGWPPDVVPGHRWIELIHHDDVERCGDAYVKAFDQRQPFQVEHRLRRHDGEYRWTVSVGVPRYGTDHSFAGYVGTAVDTTERKLAENAVQQSHAALRERTAELERRTAQLSQLASDLTLVEQHAREQLAKTLHDGLQQQLAVAALHLEQHMNRDSQQGITATPLARVKQELDEAITAARSLSVELSPPVLQSAGLPTALACLADWSQQKYGLEVRVSADPFADSPRKDIRTLLFESVRELLFNVVKHAQVDQVTVDLTLDAHGNLCITVADQGIGFDPVELDARANIGVLGRGLSSIRERVTLLRGRFDIESTPGRGARFRVIAPAGTALGDVPRGSPLVPTVLGPASPHTAASSTSARALRILVADDHIAVREALREMLQARPEFQVVGDAANGLEAIAEAHRLQPDVVLMDVSMPEMDGIEATRRIRAEPPFVRVLALSMHPRMEDHHPIELEGAEGFFNKGIDTQRLISHLLTTHAAGLSAHSG